MAIHGILIYPNSKLRELANPVVDPASFEVAQLVNDLAETMYNAPGVGLAANQIGIALRVAVTDTNWRREGESRDLRVWINPEITHMEGSALFEEGCLSVPEVFEEVERAASITVTWQDIEGARHTADFEGFEAVALQHEFDHLDGKLFIDRLSLLKQKLIKKRLRKRKKMAG